MHAAGAPDGQPVPVPCSVKIEKQVVRSAPHGIDCQWSYVQWMGYGLWSGTVRKKAIQNAAPAIQSENAVAKCSYICYNMVA